MNRSKIIRLIDRLSTVMSMEYRCSVYGASTMISIECRSSIDRASIECRSRVVTRLRMIQQWLSASINSLKLELVMYVIVVKLEWHISKQLEFDLSKLSLLRYIDYFIEGATYGFLFTSCKTLENERLSAANERVFQSLATSE